jgi:hypothetical protein
MRHYKATRVRDRGQFLGFYFEDFEMAQGKEKN